MHRAKSTFILGLLLLLFLPAQAQSEALNRALGERIEFVQTGGPASVTLQVTVFQPDGPGPFPVAIINHGKDIGNPRMQARNRPIAATRQFLARGYAVVAPMLHGFAGSGGTLVQHGCDTRANGEAPTQDLAAVIKWLQTQTWADTDNMLMAGQSYGGLATMAYSQDPDPGVKLFINFAGGVRYADDCDWEKNLREAFKSYGQKSQAPSVWFYGENDSYFPPRVIKPAFQAFEDAGGKGEMVAYGPFGKDAHAMFANVDGVEVWLDKVLQTMKHRGLPIKVILPRYGRTDVGPAPTGHADADVDDFKSLRQVDALAGKAYSAF